MAKYVVEQINRGRIERVETIDTTTPIKAAIYFAGCDVTFRRDEQHWIKVVSAGAQRVFEFVKV